METITACKALSIVTILFLLLSGAQALTPYHFSHHGKGSNYKSNPKEGELGMELYPTGSSPPDCSHACGPCSPCRRVIVSFNKCAPLHVQRKILPCPLQLRFVSADSTISSLFLHAGIRLQIAVFAVVVIVGSSPLAKC